jgi:glycosyltransferase involved in cell wall biosynthesis
MAAAPRARVIIATYNQIPYMRLVLRGYLRQTTNDFSLVLADDGSSPDMAEFLQKISPEFAERGIPLEHVWHEDIGWRKNRIMNEAVRRAGDEKLLIFTDGDCIPPAHFVARHLEVHEPLSFHVGGASRLSREISERITESDVDSGEYEDFGTAEDRKVMLKKKRKSFWGTMMRRRNRPKILGLNMAFGRELFENVNGFDERFERPYLGEDTDLRDRVMRWRPRPRVRVLYTRNDVFHLWHTSGERSREDNRLYYRQKRPVRCVMGLVQPE